MSSLDDPHREEVFTLAQPWTNQVDGQLTTIRKLWVDHQNCWFLVGEIFYNDQIWLY